MTYFDFGPALPERYGTPRIRLLAQDPTNLYVYWEGGTVLRILDQTVGSIRQLDVKEIGSWFGSADPEHEYQAEIGKRIGGSFVVIARSDRIQTPRGKTRSQVFSSSSRNR
jgi:hypothetical protein